MMMHHLVQQLCIAEPAHSSPSPEDLYGQISNPRNKEIEGKGRGRERERERGRELMCKYSFVELKTQRYEELHVNVGKQQ